MRDEVKSPLKPTKESIVNSGGYQVPKTVENDTRSQEPELVEINLEQLFEGYFPQVIKERESVSMGSYYSNVDSSDEDDIPVITLEQKSLQQNDDFTDFEQDLNPEIKQSMEEYIRLYEAVLKRQVEN